MFCCPCIQRPSPPQLPECPLQPVSDSWKLEYLFETSTETEIGKGTFARVHRIPLTKSQQEQVKTTDQYSVAKVITMDEQKENVKKSFDIEVAILSHFSNTTGFPQFYGYQMGNSYVMYMKYYTHGSLYELIKNDFQHPLFPNGYRFHDVYRILSNLASAIQSLHNLQLSHNDIKALNVLLSHDLIGVGAVLVDFGMAKPVSRTSKFQVSTFASLSPHYASPDAIESYETGKLVQRVEHGIKLQQNDIYAFGVLMFELTIGQLAWSSKSTEAIINLTQMGKRPLDIYLEQRKDGLKMLTTSQKSIIKLCQQCWAHQRTSRPTINTLIKKLSSIKPRE